MAALSWIRLTLYMLAALFDILGLAFAGFLIWHLRQPLVPRE